MDRPRVLLIGDPSPPLAAWLGQADVAAVRDPAAATARLRDEPFAGVVAPTAAVDHMLAAAARNALLMEHVDGGLALLDVTGRITYANRAFRAWCPGDPLGRPLLDALDTPTVSTADPDPVGTALAGKPVAVRLHRPKAADQPFLDLRLQPVPDPAGAVSQVVVLCRDVTPEVQQQQKLDALHQAGKDLAGLDPAQLAEMNIPTRVELLKQNLRRYIHDLLHYDIIEVRVLDRRSGELRPLLEDGMTKEAARRVLYARPTGNGVTGHVAHTGKSYLINDTVDDPLYLEGASGARSSMTVPLKFNDEVVGTLNVESPRLGGFGPDDMQFTELFSKEIAAALHTLDLLSAQVTCTASQSIAAVNREIALPVDDVLASAAVLLAKAKDDPESATHLRRILANARAVKDSVLKVGRELAAVAVSATSADLPLAGKRVLIVDCDERTRRTAHLTLERLGAEVETASTAGEGLALVAGSGGYDGVFLDVKPPDMGGYEAYKRFRAASPGGGLALTTGFGYDAAHSIVKARQEGLRFVLFKPFRQDQVVKALTEPSFGPPPVPAAANGAV